MTGSQTNATRVQINKRTRTKLPYLAEIIKLSAVSWTSEQTILFIIKFRTPKNSFTQFKCLIAACQMQNGFNMAKTVQSKINL